jgi:hypothetical protein
MDETILNVMLRRSHVCVCECGGIYRIFIYPHHLLSPHRTDSATPHCQRQPYRKASPEVAAAIGTWTAEMHSVALTNFQRDTSTGGRGLIPRERSQTPRRSERGPTKARSRELERGQEETKSLQAEVAALKLELSSAPDAAGIREESKSELDLLKKQLTKCQSDLKTAQKKKQPGLSPAQKGQNTKARKALEEAQEKAQTALEEAQQQVGQLTDRLSQQVALDLRCLPGPSTYLHSFTRPSVAGNSDYTAGGSTRRK